MIISKKGLDLIKKWEGCPTDKNGMCVAYQDCVSVWTLGWGMIDSDEPYTGIHIKKGVKITKKQADELFERLVKAKYCPKVDKYMSKYKFNQNQYDALVSFAYNIGSIDQLTANGTRTIKEISDKFTAYCKAGGKTVQGLLNRRQDEKKLFDTPVATVKVKEKYTGKALTQYPSRGYFQRGDYYPGVGIIQDFLNWYFKNRKGFEKLKKDLDYGSRTEQWTFKLQEENHLPTNGKFGEKCNAVLLKCKTEGIYR